MVRPILKLKPKHRGKLPDAERLSIMRKRLHNLIYGAGDYEPGERVRAIDMMDAGIADLEAAGRA